MPISMPPNNVARLPVGREPTETLALELFRLMVQGVVGTIAGLPEEKIPIAASHIAGAAFTLARAFDAATVAHYQHKAFEAKVAAVSAES